MATIERCPNCKRDFWVPYAQWGYAYNGQRCCSYKCMRAMREKDPEHQNAQAALVSGHQFDEKQEGAKTVSARKKMTPEDKEKAVAMYNLGRLQRDIAEELGFSESTISTCISKARAEGKIQQTTEPVQPPEALEEIAPGMYLKPADPVEKPERVPKAQALMTIVETVRTLSTTLTALVKLLEESE